jgi:hypothetical protein
MDLREVVAEMDLPKDRRVHRFGARLPVVKPPVVDRWIVVYAPIVGKHGGAPERQEFPSTVAGRYTYRGVPCIDLPRYWGLVK